MPDREHLERVAEDPIVKVVARSFHESSTHVAQLVVGRREGTKCRRSHKRAQYLVELLLEKGGRRQAVRLPPRVDARDVIDSARMKDDPHEIRSARAQTSKHVRGRDAFRRIAAREPCFKLRSLFGGQLPRFVVDRSELDFRSIRKVGGLVDDEPAISHVRADRQHVRSLALSIASAQHWRGQSAMRIFTSGQSCVAAELPLSAGRQAIRSNVPTPPGDAAIADTTER